MESLDDDIPSNPDVKKSDSEVEDEKVDEEMPLTVGGEPIMPAPEE